MIGQRQRHCTHNITKLDSVDIEQNINIVILSKVYKNKYLPDLNSLKLFS